MAPLSRVLLVLFLHVGVDAFTPLVHQKAQWSTGTATSTTLNVNIASQLVLEEAERQRKRKQQLTRPERKALERERKRNRSNVNHRRHNFKDRAHVLNSRRAPHEGRYDLHSTAVSTLSKDSTADDVLKAIKRAQNLHDVHDIRAIERFLLEEVDHSFAYGYRGSLLARLAVAALHMENHRLARKAIKERKLNHRSSMMPMESAAILRGLLRVHNVTDAFEVLDDELSLPLAVSTSEKGFVYCCPLC